MKLGLWFLLSILIVPAFFVTRTVTPCGLNLISHVAFSNTAVVSHIEDGTYLPLYGEPFRTGGTNGGLEKSAIVHIEGIPTCADGGIWWHVTTDQDARGYPNEGYVYEVIFKVDMEGKGSFQRTLEPIIK